MRTALTSVLLVSASLVAAAGCGGATTSDEASDAGGSAGAGGVGGAGGAGGSSGSGGAGGLAGSGGAGGASGSAGAGGTGGSSPATSCLTPGDGLSNCGPSSNEDCCTSPLVPRGTVQLNSTHTATVSDYKLDKYEITVGRFRKFVDAVVAGWTPPVGSGKHTHINGGSGLSDGNGGYEPGWDVAWNTNLAATKAEWDSNLSCDAAYQTWTSVAAANEKRPINCAIWYQAEAFCIWDGGFLPSEGEWQYAAAGGSEGRQYPWSVPASSTTVDCSYANYYTPPYCHASYTTDVGLESPKGDGKWGQSDLAGNMWEWTLDWYVSPYANAASTNYANVAASSYRVVRGGSFNDYASYLLASYRYGITPTYRYSNFGARCARTP